MPPGGGARREDHSTVQGPGVQPEAGGVCCDRMRAQGTAVLGEISQYITPRNMFIFWYVYRKCEKLWGIMCCLGEHTGRRREGRGEGETVVGGSTKIPKVQELLQNFFNG